MAQPQLVGRLVISPSTMIELNARLSPRPVFELDLDGAPVPTDPDVHADLFLIPCDTYYAQGPAFDLEAYEPKLGQFNRGRAWPRVRTDTGNEAPTKMYFAWNNANLQYGEKNAWYMLAVQVSSFGESVDPAKNRICLQWVQVMTRGKRHAAKGSKVLTEEEKVWAAHFANWSCDYSKYRPGKGRRTQAQRAAE
ncbi:hypothetical protein B0T16DRAFT_392773 [Cercophora newfieldiana]|uniref:Uncharacterized protein n=1 Tax=Cercophora newfieldiana TaxID=92897 RepID=A0AA39Y1R8_9PEZI|nr:hypothetical protein B0T16DRAFT_392773 [Cercophora newfieldiana]